MLVPFVGPTRLFVGAGETGANGNYYFGLHEFEDMAFLIHFLRSEDLFLDVGANVGSYTILASGAAGARTVAFEPVPETLVRLKANCAANGIASRVSIRGVCIGASDGTVSFSTGANTMNSIVAEDSPRPLIKVPMRRLDSEVCEPAIAIKIDAEGYDDDVLAGATALLEGQSPLVLLAETLGGGNFGRTSEETECRLRQLGFVRCRYDPFRRQLIEGVGSVYNNLFIRRVQFAQARTATAPRYLIHGFGCV